VEGETGARAMSRDAILSKIRASLGEKSAGEDARRRGLVAERLNGHPQGIVPASQDAGKGIVAQFVKKATEAAASVEVVKRGEAGAAITKFLRDHNLPQTLRRGADPRLSKIAWPKGGPQIVDGPSDGRDLSGLSHAFAGVSETGTLLLTSGPENPTTINFLPENHVVLVEASDIEANYEAAFARLRKKDGGAMPRTVNMITGPSRSADIEQTLILGAHGPVRLHIVVVED
jgi:L-lactate dehydrogenase complex protein LldG